MRSAPGEDAPARSAAVSAEGPLPRLPCARRQSPVRPLLLFTTLVIALARLPCGAWIRTHRSLTLNGAPVRLALLTPARLRTSCCAHVYSSLSLAIQTL